MFDQYHALEVGGYTATSDDGNDVCISHRDASGTQRVIAKMPAEIAAQLGICIRSVAICALGNIDEHEV